MAEKASEETPSDNKPAVEIQKFPVDTSHASRKVWLIKIPLAIRDSWLKAPRDEIIGEIQPKNPKIGKNHMTVHMAPKYKVNIGSEFTVTEGECNQLQAFSINSDGSRVWEGVVSFKGDVGTSVTNEYQNVCRTRTGMGSTPKKKVVILDAPVDSENTIMELSHSQFKQATLRADRVDKEQLKKLLFGYFEEQEYYTVQELHKKTDQPSNVIKEVLQEICEYVQNGPYKSHWKLK